MYWLCSTNPRELQRPDNQWRVEVPTYSNSNVTTSTHPRTGKWTSHHCWHVPIPCHAIWSPWCTNNLSAYDASMTLGTMMQLIASQPSRHTGTIFPYTRDMDIYRNGKSRGCIPHPYILVSVLDTISYNTLLPYPSTPCS